MLLSQFEIVIKMENISEEAAMLRKKMGRERYNDLRREMVKIVKRFKDRQNRMEERIVQPLTPSTEVTILFIYRKLLVLNVL